MNHLLPSVNFDSMTIEDNSDYNMVIQSTILQAVAPAAPAPWHVQLVSPLLPIGTPPWLASAVTLFTLALTGFALYTLYQCYKTHRSKAVTAELLAQIDEGADNRASTSSLRQLSSHPRSNAKRRTQSKRANTSQLSRSNAGGFQPGWST